jgi:hypothetical protein
MSTVPHEKSTLCTTQNAHQYIGKLIDLDIEGAIGVGRVWIWLYSLQKGEGLSTCDGGPVGGIGINGDEAGMERGVEGQGRAMAIWGRSTAIVVGSGRRERRDPEDAEQEEVPLLHEPVVVWAARSRDLLHAHPKV